jgi:hypothetical protein
MTPTWTQRSYKIFASKHLKYYDKTTEKGSVDISNIELEPGTAEHLRNCGSSKAAVAIAVLPTDAHGNRTNGPLLFTVFDSKQEAHKFVVGLAEVSKVHRLKEFLQKSKLEIPELKFDESLVRTLRKEEEIAYEIRQEEAGGCCSCVLA